MFGSTVPGHLQNNKNRQDEHDITKSKIIRACVMKKIFYAVFLSSLLVFLISVPLTHAWSLKLYLWKSGSSFYDFYTCLKGNIYWKRGQLYSDGSIYPPLANFFYAVLTRCMSVETLQTMNELNDYNKIKALQECSIYFALYLCISILLYYMVCTYWKQGNKLEKIAFSVMFLFSVPFLYQFERANIIFLALVLIMIFFAWKDSKIWWQRECAYISLAIAAGIKIYPAVLGLIIVKERKYRDALRLLVYGVLFFFLPFLFYGGIRENFTYLIRNLIQTSSEVSVTRIGCQIGFGTVLKNLTAVFGSHGVFFSNVFIFTVTVLALFSFWMLEEQWKAVLLLVCLMIGTPSISYVYSMIFMIIPIVMFLDSGDKHYFDLVYLAGMILVVIPLPFCWTEGSGDQFYSYMNVSTPVWIEGLCVLTMTLLLTEEGILQFLRSRRSIFASLIALAAVICAVGTGVVIYEGQIENPYAYTNYLPYVLSDWISLENGDELTQTFTASGSSLNSVILRISADGEGTLDFSVSMLYDKGEILKTVSADLENIVKGYNEIDFDDCTILPDAQYKIKITAVLEGDAEVRIWKTVDSAETHGEVLEKNGEGISGALGVKVNEYAVKK